jgi:hypothetical protein
MHKTRLQVNVGSEENDVPSVEDCLKDVAGKFYSTQNAVRVHEWLRGTETVPLVLEAVKQNEDGTVDHITLGSPDIRAYAETYFPGQLLKLEQSRIAVPKMHETMAYNHAYFLAHPTERNQEAMGTAILELMKNVSSIWAFNASSMYFGTPIPKRFIFESVETLKILFTCVLTQRDKVLYETEETYAGTIPPEIYSRVELDRILFRIHQAMLEGFFPNPEVQAKADGLMDVSFYKQCAMAISANCSIRIPRDYVEEKTTRVYHWATKILNEVAWTVNDHRLDQQVQNVVTLFPKRNAN